MSTNMICSDEPADISFGAVYINDSRKQRKCPLCKDNLYLYNLNFEEMMLMCENLDCDFPFGHEAMQIVYDENELRNDPLPATDDFFMYPIGGVTQSPIGSSVTTTSMIPSTCLTDLDHLSFTCDSESGSQDILSVRLSKQSKQRKVRKEMTKEIETNLDSIKRLNNEMVQLTTCDKHIRKQKWLNTLLTWQGHSGKQLLKDEEMRILKKNEPVFALGELKISVDPEAEVPSVDIQIVNKN